MWFWMDMRLAEYTTKEKIKQTKKSWHLKDSKIKQFPYCMMRGGWGGLFFFLLLRKMNMPCPQVGKLIVGDKVEQPIEVVNCFLTLVDTYSLSV